MTRYAAEINVGRGTSGPGGEDDRQKTSGRPQCTAGGDLRRGVRRTFRHLAPHARGPAGDAGGWPPVQHLQPLLYQVATAGLNPGDVTYPAGFRGTVRGDLPAWRAGRDRFGVPPDQAHQRPRARLRLPRHRHRRVGRLPRHRGAADHTFGLYTRSDAIALRDHLMAAFERLSVEDGDLHVTVAGGGATGVELAGTLAELSATVLAATFPDVDPARVHVRLIEMAPALLGGFDQKLREYARVQLDKRGVDIRLNTRIGEITGEQVLLADGENLPSGLTVWAAGVGASGTVEGWGLPQGKGGRILVGPDLRVQGQDRIFAVGDIAVNPDDPTPQLAQPALQMGATPARRSSGCSGDRDRAVHVPRQGHDGHHRAPVGRGPAGPGPAAARHARLAGLARPAPVLPARRPQPGVDDDQPGLPLRRLGPWRRGDRRGRSSGSLASSSQLSTMPRSRTQ